MRVRAALMTGDFLHRKCSGNHKVATAVKHNLATTDAQSSGCFRPADVSARRCLALLCLRLPSKVTSEWSSRSAGRLPSGLACTDRPPALD